MRAVGVCVIIATLISIIFEVRMCFASTSALDRCEPFRAQVEAILESEGVDTAYYFLMVAESRCTERAVSPKGAQGFWQLMPRTARHYGCADPHELECATRAAARYIRHLQSAFNRFDDVIIAYNMGGHNYKRTKASRQSLGLVWKVKELMKCQSNAEADGAKR